MQPDSTREKSLKKRKTKGLTWAEAAKTVMEKYPKTPMTPKEIWSLIERENLKEITGTGPPQACLNAMLHANSRGRDSLFYKVAGRVGVYGLTSCLPEGAVFVEVDEEENCENEQTSPNNPVQPQLVVSEDGNMSNRPALPTTPTPTSGHKTGFEKRKEKVVYVRLPDDYYKSQSSPVGLSSPSSNVTIGDVCTDNSVSGCGELSITVELSMDSSEVDLPSNGSKSVMESHAVDEAVGQPERQHRTTTLLPSHRLLRHRRNGRRGHGINSCLVNENICASTPDPVNAKQPAVDDFAAFIPDFRLKPRKRSNQKLSRAAQIRQTRHGCIDLETPNSILVNTDLRVFINKHTFSALPAVYQYSLMQMLPECDQLTTAEGMSRLGATALNNEFLTNAFNEWKDRLSDGEFTQENKIRMKHEGEKEQMMTRIDPWKIKHFESSWGQKSSSSSLTSSTIAAAVMSDSVQHQRHRALSSSIVPQSCGRTTRTTVAALAMFNNSELNRLQIGDVKADVEHLSFSPRKLDPEFSDCTPVSVLGLDNAATRASTISNTITDAPKTDAVSTDGALLQTPAVTNHQGSKRSRRSSGTVVNAKRKPMLFDDIPSDKLEAAADCFKLAVADTGTEDRCNQMARKSPDLPSSDLVSPPITTVGQVPGKTRRVNSAIMDSICVKVAEKPENNSQSAKVKPADLETTSCSPRLKGSICADLALPSSYQQSITSPTATVTTTVFSPSKEVICSSSSDSISAICANNQTLLQHLKRPSGQLTTAAIDLKKLKLSPATPPFISATSSSPLQQNLVPTKLSASITEGNKLQSVSASVKLEATSTAAVSVSGFMMQSDEENRLSVTSASARPASLVSLESNAGHRTTSSPKLVNSSSVRQSAPQPVQPPVKQTKTLAQIKAQMGAKRQARNLASVGAQSNSSVCALEPSNESCASSQATCSPASSQTPSPLTGIKLEPVGGCSTASVLLSSEGISNRTSPNGSVVKHDVDQTTHVTTLPTTTSSVTTPSPVRFTTSAGSTQHAPLSLKILRVASSSGQLSYRLLNSSEQTTGSSKTNSSKSLTSTSATASVSAASVPVVSSPSTGAVPAQHTCENETVTSTSSAASIVADTAVTSAVAFSATKNGTHSAAPSVKSSPLVSPTKACDYLSSVSHSTTATAISHAAKLPTSAGYSGMIPNSWHLPVPYASGPNLYSSSQHTSSSSSTMMSKANFGQHCYNPGVSIFNPVIATAAASSFSPSKSGFLRHLQFQVPSLRDVDDNSDQSLAVETCACNLKAMVACQKCGAFCHDDCIGPSKLCVTCLVAT